MSEPRPTDDVLRLPAEIEAGPTVEEAQSSRDYWRPRRASLPFCPEPGCFVPGATLTVRIVALIRSWSRPRVFLAALVLSILAVGATAGGIVDDATDSSHLGAAVFAT